MNIFQKIYYHKSEYIVTLDLKGNFSALCEVLIWLIQQHGQERDGWWYYQNEKRYLELGITKWTGKSNFYFKRREDALAFKLTWM